MRRSLRVLLVFALTLSSLLIVQTSASAAPTRNGICEDGEVCFYFNSNQAGALSDMTYPLGDYGSGASCNHFIGAGKNGAGYCLKNNAASVWNRTKQIAVVHYNSQFLGASQPFNPQVKANLNSTLKNQNASHSFKNVPPPPPTIFTIHSAAFGTCLDSDFNGKAYHETCNGGRQQQWQVFRVTTTPTVQDPIQLMNVGTMRCLDARSPRAGGPINYVYTQPCNGGNYQLWDDYASGNRLESGRIFMMPNRAFGGISAISCAGPYSYFPLQEMLLYPCDTAKVSKVGWYALPV